MERVKKDLPPGIEVDDESVVEYIWEALSKIGAKHNYITLYSLLEVIDYKTRLPGWLHLLNQVRYLTNNVDLFDDEEGLKNAAKSGQLMSTVLNTFDLRRTTNNVGDHVGHRYVVKDNYIHTTFEKGIIEISYDAFPVDEEGYPVIPQNVHFIEAVKWYIVHKYLWRLTIKDTTYISLFQYAEKEWLFYCNSSAAKAKLPNQDGMYAHLEKFLRIIPNLHRNMRYNYYRDPIYTKDDLTSLVFITDKRTISN